MGEFERSLIPIHLQVIPSPCEDQLLLVDLISAIKVLPMDTLVQTVKQVLKQPPNSELSRGKVIYIISSKTDA